MLNKKVLCHALRRLELTGQNPLKTNSFSVVMVIIWIAVSIIFGVHVVMYILNNDNIIQIGENTANLLVWEGAAFKLFNVIYQRKALVRALNRLENFWELDKFGNSWYKVMNGSFSRYLKLCYIYDILYFATAAFYSAIVLGQRKFPVEIYNGITDFHAPVVFEIIYSLQVIYIFFTLTFMAGYDLLLFVLAGHAYCEFRMLKRAFRDLPFERESKEEVIKKFNEYVDHHNEVIQFVDELNNAYSIFFLNHYFLTALAVCMALLVINITISPFQPKFFIKFLLYVLCWYLQMAMYCISGTLVTSEGQSVAESIYDSDWVKEFYPELRKGIVLVIERSQKKVEISIGRLLVLSLESFAQIVKMTYSVFMLMKSVLNN